jgi:prepilin-type N-terminal cleavage/methylation domain-containing protein
MGRQGFTLIETLIIIAVLGVLLAATLPPFARFSAQLALNTTANNIVSELRALQSQAAMRHKTLWLNPDKIKLLNGIKFLAEKELSFSPSGCPPPGGSGTLIIINKFNKIKKIILSSAGRVRVE